MWARVGTTFLTVEKNCVPQRHRIARHIRTQCINLHPRGQWRRDTIDVNQTVDVGGGHVSGEATTRQAVHRKDTRTIDTMDPVVLKYTNMINDMRSGSDGVEKIHETHFGSIRFDQENTPHLHGLVDQECSPAEASTDTTVHHHTSTSHGSGRGEVLAGGVDSFTGGSEEEVKMNDGNPRDGSYFDDCVFGDYISPTSRISKSSPVDHMQDSASVTNTSKISDAASNDLSYIDEVFFKNSLENLEINRQPAIEYSNIKDDIEKAILSGERHGTSEESEIILEHGPENVQQKCNDKDTKQRLNTAENSEAPRSAYDYVVRMRREELKRQQGLGQKPGDGSNKSYRKILGLLSEKTKKKHTRYEVLKSLKSSILYNDSKCLHLGFDY